MVNLKIWNSLAFLVQWDKGETHRLSLFTVCLFTKTTEKMWHTFFKLAAQKIYTIITDSSWAPKVSINNLAFDQIIPIHNAFCYLVKLVDNYLLQSIMMSQGFWPLTEWHTDDISISSLNNFIYCIGHRYEILSQLINEFLSKASKTSLWSQRELWGLAFRFISPSGEKGQLGLVT